MVPRSRGFVRLLVGQSVSSLGDWVPTLAFIAASYTISHHNHPGGPRDRRAGIGGILILLGPVAAKGVARRGLWERQAPAWADGG